MLAPWRAHPGVGLVPQIWGEAVAVAARARVAVGSAALERRVAGVARVLAAVVRVVAARLVEGARLVVELARVLAVLAAVRLSVLASG